MLTALGAHNSWCCCVVGVYCVLGAHLAFDVRHNLGVLHVHYVFGAFNACHVCGVT